MELTHPNDIYAYRLGAVWARILTLETLLRVAISGGQFSAPFDVSVGDKLKADDVNKRAYLGGLIKKYNKLVGSTRPELGLGARHDLENLRNAFAHGLFAVLVDMEIRLPQQIRQCACSCSPSP